jgi:hypothetical protein
MASVFDFKEKQPLERAATGDYWERMVSLAIVAHAVGVSTCVGLQLHARTSQGGCRRLDRACVGVSTARRAAKAPRR